MKSWIAAGTGLALLAGGVAMAQVPSAPPGPPPGGPAAGMEGRPMDGGPDGPRQGPMMGGGRWREMMRMHMHMRPPPPPPPSKAAHFRFRKGDAMVDIKCADDEPTKACVDAGSALLDKLAAQPK